MAEDMKKGLFITFEGPEGSGKSTQSGLIFDSLAADGYLSFRTAEPGGTALGERIRDILLERDDIRMDSVAELFLFQADRAQHVEEVILPAIEGGKIVLCDRFNTATFAYQGYGLGIDLDVIRCLDDIARKGLDPDLTIVLDIEVEAGIARATSDRMADRMEKRELDFHRKVRNGYLDMAKKSPDKIKVIGTSGPVEDVYRKVRKEVYDLIEGHKRTD